MYVNIHTLLYCRNILRLCHYGTASGFHHTKYDEITEIFDNYIDKFIEASLPYITYEEVDMDIKPVLYDKDTSSALHLFESAYELTVQTMEENAPIPALRNIVASFKEDIEPLLKVLHQYA